MNQTAKFRIALTADFFDESGNTKFPQIGDDVLDGQHQIEKVVMDRLSTPIEPDQLAGVHGVVVLTPPVDASSLAQSEDLLAVARFGVGYDSVDVEACTAADVMLTITTGAVDRPVAEATVGWMIALSHHMLVKDRLVREGRWSDRSRYMGGELRDRTLGIVGLGGIARSTLSLLQPFGMNRPLAFDPFVSQQAAQEAGVDLVGLDELLERADFVSIHCPLTPKTRGLIGAAQFANMKEGAFLINTARGGIVDEDALAEALSSGRIGGAALDCFDGEPITQPSRFRDFENVLLAPHSIAWTNELFRDIGRTAFRGLVELTGGRRPHGIVNPEVLGRPGFREKWSRVTGVELDRLPT